jgi:hypothetical protein
MKEKFIFRNDVGAEYIEGDYHDVIETFMTFCLNS